MPDALSVLVGIVVSYMIVLFAVRHALDPKLDDIGKKLDRIAAALGAKVQDEEGG